MKRSLVWKSDETKGWACSNCCWAFPLPTLLEGQEGRDAYDRLGAAKFSQHKCESYPAFSARKPHVEEDAAVSFAERARMLIKRGYTPKVAVDLTLGEIALESGDDPRVMQKARADSEDFLQKIRRGLI